MTETTGDQEPSMEEILASIRRIISEDPPVEGEAEAKPEAVAGHDEAEVLELTEIVEEEHPSVTPPHEAPPHETLLAEPEIEEPEIMHPPPLLVHDDAAPPIAAFPDDEEALVSAETAAASRASFASIAEEVRRRLPQHQPTGNGSETLEGIVRDLLRPMLKEWLDSHLPDLVERLVAEEIERLSQRTK